MSESGTPEIGICVVAENRLLREVLARLLNKRCDLKVLEAMPMSDNMIAAIAAIAPDVLLLDSLPKDLFELGVIREVRRVIPEVKIVMTGMENDEAKFLRAVSEGIAGYLIKDATAGEVATAVRCVMNGEAVCPPTLCMSLFNYQAQNAALPRSRNERKIPLTRRERELVGLIGRGLTNKEIAGQLNLSEQTVKNHVHRMLRKVGASNRLTAVEICRSHEFYA